MQICPSILEPTAEALVRTVNHLSSFYNYFQIDIADGIFVPNKTVQIEEIEKIVQQFNNETMKQCSFDFHLMVKDYKTEIKKLEKLKNFIKINLVLIHYSVFPNPYPLVPSPSFSIGLTLNPEDQVTALTDRYPLNTIPCLQIMSVTPGVQGNPFSPDTLLKIEQLRVSGYKSKIFLDGAVNDKTLPIINKLKYKPDVLCPGSFLTKAVNLEERVKFLKNY